MSTNLRFSDLREANLKRLPHFKNRHGQPAHRLPDGSDWCLGQWGNAMQSEAGEAGNIIKKIERQDYTLDEKRDDLARELVDTIVYADILAYQAGIDLSVWVPVKWNETAVAIGYPGRLQASVGDAINQARADAYRTLASALRKFAPEVADHLVAKFETSNEALARFVAFLQHDA